MGGSSSKPKRTILREIDSTLDAQFKANCIASAQSIQETVLKNVNIIAMDNCNISVMNKASVNTTCEMGPIIDGIAEMAVSADQEFAKNLQNAQDRQANAKCDSNNCIDKIKIGVTKNLTSTCESSAKAEQSMKLIGSTIFCDGNTVAKFGNFSEVRATCLRSLLHDAVDEAFRQNTESSSSRSSSQSSIDDMIIMGAIALIAIILLTKKKYSNTNEKN